MSNKKTLIFFICCVVNLDKKTKTYSWRRPFTVVLLALQFIEEDKHIFLPARIRE